MFRRNRIPLAIIAVAGFTTLLLAGIVLATDNPVSYYAQQRYLYLRYRVEQLLPQPTLPQFVPTPLNITVVFMTEPAPTPSPPTPSPILPTSQLSANSLPVTTPVPQPSSSPSSPQPTSDSTQIPATPMPLQTPTPGVDLVAIQPSVTLSGIKHEYQGWNNCGPTTLKMYLSYYGRSDTQKDIATFTKPDWDDKNVSPSELAAYASQVGMQALVRENGTLDRLKLLLSNGLPVMIESGFVTPSGKEGWMGHYKLLSGYDDAQFTFMDSYNGPNQKITFGAVDADWRAFNRVYLIVFPSDKLDMVRAIVGDDLNDVTMFTRAAARARSEIEASPKDAFAYYNLGTSLNGLQQYTDAATAFDRARVLGLPWRMMWYQFGPYVAYLQTNRYDEVIALANATLRPLDDLEESHFYKGLALRALGRADDARREFETALHYNKNYQDAQRALQASSN